MGSAIVSKTRTGSYKEISGKTFLYVSTTGSDNNNGLSSTKPFRTIKKAFDFLSSYHIPENASVTISLADGNYNVSSTLVMDHPDGIRITLKGGAQVVGSVTSVSNYLDTTSYKGKVGNKQYGTVIRDYNTDTIPTTSSRFDMVLTSIGATNIPQTNASIGKFVCVSPFSDGEIQMNHNSASLGNGNLADNTEVKRYIETGTTMSRFFTYGAFRIKTNAADFGKNPVLVNPIRNINVYDGISNSVTSRIHTLSNPVGTPVYAGSDTNVPVRYLSSVINLTGPSLDGIRVTNQSGLNLKDVAIMTSDPITGVSGKSKSSGVVVENGSTLVLHPGVAVSNFNIGIEIKQRSNLIQNDSSENQFQSVVSCGTGILVNNSSTATLNGLIVSGCWNDGFVANNHSSLTLSSCISTGNGQHGVIASRNSSIIATRCVSCFNLQNAGRNFNELSEGGAGFACRLNSNGEFTGCMSFRNGFGYLADKGSSLNISSSDSLDNVNRAVSLSETSSGVVGPFFYSSADASGVYVSDASFGRTYSSTFEYSGFETAASICGDAITVAANSTINAHDITVSNYAKNAIQALYSSNFISDTITVTENASTEGDSINCTYNSVCRVAGSKLGSRPRSKTGLLEGYIEVGGIEE